MGELSGKIVVVPVAWAGAAGLATRLGAAGATVVLVGDVGDDGEAAGRLAAAVEAGGAGRPAVFVGDGTPEGLDALAGFLSELFRPS